MQRIRYWEPFNVTILLVDTPQSRIRYWDSGFEWGIKIERALERGLSK